MLVNAKPILGFAVDCRIITMWLDVGGGGVCFFQAQPNN
jgi:hypothetical protein